MSIIRKIFSVATSTAAVAAVLSLTPAAAQAEPWPATCSKGSDHLSTGPAYGWAKCTTGAGYVQANVKCTNNTFTQTVTGPWVWIGTESRGICPIGNYYVVSVGINKKTA
jgi:hypothetical protein